MFFITRFHFPRFSSTNYQKQIEERLRNRQVLHGECHKYNALLRLREQAANMAASLDQLWATSSSKENLRPLFSELPIAIIAAANEEDPSQYMGGIRNRLALVKSDLQEDKSRKLGAGLFLLANYIVAGASIAGIVILGMAVGTGPIGWALLAVVMAILSALVLMVAAYSMYVDGRTLFDTQIKEIEEGVKFLEDYPTLLQGPPSQEIEGDISPHVVSQEL